MGGETSSDDDDLGVSRVRVGVRGSISHVPVVTALSSIISTFPPFKPICPPHITQSRWPARWLRPGLRVPKRVEFLYLVARAPFHIGHVLVGVGSRNEDGSISEKEGGRVVQSLLRRVGETITVESRTRGCVGTDQHQQCSCVCNVMTHS